MICARKHIFVVPVLLLVFGNVGFVNPQTPAVVTLTSSAAPSSGEPGVTIVNVIGANFPTGTIVPASVTVSLQPASPGHPSATTTATSVATIGGSARRVYFLVPSSLIVSTPTAYEVSISGTTTTGTAFASGNTASLTVTPPAQISAASPGAGSAGQTLSLTITGIYSIFTQGATAVSLGAGISVGGAAEGAFGPVTVNSTTSATAQLTIDAAAAAGSRTVIAVTGAERASLANGFSVTPATTSITGFSPSSGPIGTLVTAAGTNFTSSTGTGPQITLNKLGGGTILAPVSAFTATSASFVVPDGAATGPVNLTVGTQSVTSTSAFTVTTSSSFTLNVAPSSTTLIQGQAVAFTISLSSNNGFSSLAALSVSDVPAGVTSSFAPTQITAGQTSVLTLSAPANQTLGKSTLTVSASAMINGQTFAQSAGTSLQITGVSTTFVGRTVVDDSEQQPIAGVTVKFLGVDDKGNVTGCSGHTSSDAAGNFMLAQLPSACTGPQLIGYDGSTATSPPGKYAGVNLSYTLASGHVTSSPVLIHLPRIDNAETVQVQQNKSTDQVLTFQTIPGLVVTVYANTTFSLQDGSKPNPFPLVAIAIPVDRLPDLMPSSGMLTPFIVAFQPANAVSSQPVAVNFPNPLNVAPGTTATFMTLDPTHGYMVPYGTGTVSSDGTQFIADLDPAHSGHRYGLVHFDWHGPAPPPPPRVHPCPDCDPDPTAGQPIDISSGLDVIQSKDMAISGPRGSIAIIRTYRTLSTNPGPFGLGTNHNYSYILDTSGPNVGQAIINLDMPDGNQVPFSLQSNGTYTNSTNPDMLGTVLTNPSSVNYNLRFKDGTVYQFQTNSPVFAVPLTSIIDPNGNVITLTRNPADLLQLTQVTDPVGRTLTLTYDSSDRITSITDPLGRTVSYIYNSQGTLAMFTDAAGGVTSYTYDSQNRLLAVVDPRRVTIEQNTYDQNGRVIQQVEADGGVFKFAYSLLNPLASISPVLLTTVTDPRGNQTTYHFNPGGYLLDVTDASGQMRSFNRALGTNLILSMTGAGTCDVCGDPTAGDLSYTYDANGNMLTRTDALGNTATFTYEPTFGQVTSFTDPLGNVTRYTYDSHGNVLTEVDPNRHVKSLAYDSSGQLIQISDPLGNHASLTYDSAGNVQSLTDPRGNTTSFAYDLVSRLIGSKDALERKTAQVYDALDRPVSRTNAQGKLVSLSYDAVGNITSLADERGNITNFKYDPANRAYDVNGNLTKFIDARGQAAGFSYDGLNRLNSQTYQDGSTVTRSYDASGRPVRVVDSQGGTFDFTYDARGRLTSSSSGYGALKYKYDAAGKTISRQVVGQPALQYSYDAAEKLLTASLPQAAANFTYDAANEPVKIGRSNGVTSQYGYDAFGNLSSLVHSSGPTILNSQVYNYDAVGNGVTSSTRFAQPLVTQAVNNTYDASNSLLSSGPVSYAYDSNGNLLSKTDSSGITTYTWDSRNRLRSISAANAQRTSFSYDFHGNLISQNDSGPALNLIRNFLYDDLDNVAYISQSTGDNLSILTGRGIDEYLAVIHSSGQIEYALTDAINSTSATVDQAGKLVGTFFYEPFGATTAQGSSFPFQYTGRPPVGGGLYNYRARYYDSTTGRFLSQDPAGFAGGGTDLYQYVHSNPTTFTDQSGLGLGLCDFADTLIPFLGEEALATKLGEAAAEVGKKILEDELKDLAKQLCPKKYRKLKKQIDDLLKQARQLDPLEWIKKVCESGVNQGKKTSDDTWQNFEKWKQGINDQLGHALENSKLNPNLSQSH
jgi:RHS repeat-associated protein